MYFDQCKYYRKYVICLPRHPFPFCSYQSLAKRGSNKKCDQRCRYRQWRSAQRVVWRKGDNKLRDFADYGENSIGMLLIYSLSCGLTLIELNSSQIKIEWRTNEDQW